jgi:membrane protease YdiL (CAAX protease family)
VALGLGRLGPQVTPAQIALVAIAQDATIVGLALLLLARFAKVRPMDLGVDRPPQLLPALAAGGGLWIAAEAIGQLQARIVGPNPQTLTLIDAAHPSLQNLFIEIAVDGAFVGAAEELFFRAILFALFRQHMRFAYAAGLSSALFAATHGVGVFLPIFAVGFGLALLYERRGSLWTNALAHASFNTLTAVLIYALAIAGLLP